VPVQEIAVFILIYVIFLFVFYILVYGIALLLLRIYRLLRKIAWFARTVDSSSAAISRFWRKYFPTVIKLWDTIQSIYTDYCADLFFYGVSLVILVDRFQAFSEYARQNPEYPLWKLFAQDMIMDDMFYFWAIIFFILWVFSKGWKRKQDTKEKKALNDSLAAIQKTLEKLNRNINK